MKAEEQQTNEIVSLFTHSCAPTDRPEFVKALGLFITGPAIWPRFRMAPASSALRFHHAYDGGLLDHCIDVAQLAMKADPDNKVPRSSILAVAFLHDLHKIGNASGLPHFVPNMIKNGTVRSDKIPYESSEAATKFGVSIANYEDTAVGRELGYLLEQASVTWADGDLSLALVAAIDPILFKILSDDEKFSIRHHALAYDRQNRHLLTGQESHLVLLLHYCDMVSSRRARWAEAMTAAV